MSRDKSLKSASALTRHRNVLSRIERIEKLREEERWAPDAGPYGLPKVAHRKVAVGGKEKKAAKAEGTEAAPAATPTEGERK